MDEKDETIKSRTVVETQDPAICDRLTSNY